MCVRDYRLPPSFPLSLIPLAVSRPLLISHLSYSSALGIPGATDLLSSFCLREDIRRQGRRWGSTASRQLSRLTTTNNQKSTMPSYKFTYFHGRGIGEVSRQLFALSDTPFEDVRLVGEEWLKIKDQSPWGHLPWLEVDGKVLCQSLAIARYLANQFGYAGKTPFESAMVDALGDQYKDYWNEMKPFFMPMYKQNMEGMKDEFEKKKKEVAEPARDKFYGILTREYKKNGSTGYLVGDAITWVDLVVVDHMGVLDHYVPGFMDGFEEMRVLQKRVNAHPKIAEWLKKRPHTPQ